MNMALIQLPTLFQLSKSLVYITVHQKCSHLISLNNVKIFEELQEVFLLSID